MKPIYLHQSVKSLLGLVALVLLVSWNSEIGDRPVSRVFKHLQPSFEVTDFVAHSKFKDDHQVAYETLMNELDALDIPFSLIVREKHPSHQKAPQTFTHPSALRFLSDNGQCQIEILPSSDQEELIYFWKRADQALGIRTEIENSESSNVYFKVKTTEPSMVGALIFTGSNVMSVKLPLSFPIPGSYDELSESEQATIHEKFITLHRILEAMAKSYVASSEFVHYPTR